MNLPYYAGKAFEAIASRARARAWAARHPGARVGRGEPDYQAIDAALRDAHFSPLVENYTVDARGFDDWVRDARYPWDSYIANRTEKYLEHYVSYDLLRPSAGQTLIDIASCRSFFPTIVRRRNVTVVAQDLTYPEGLVGDRLGGDAANMDVPDNFADGMTLHCSFEHFEQDADTRFVRECARVLKPGGKTVILPCYLHHEYLIETDPFATKNGLDVVDEGASVVASFGYANRHGRHYDVSALARRVIAPARDCRLRVRLVNILNARAIDPSCYLRYALILEKATTGS